MCKARFDNSSVVVLSLSLGHNSIPFPPPVTGYPWFCIRPLRIGLRSLPLTYVLVQAGALPAG